MDYENQLSSNQSNLQDTMDNERNNDYSRNIDSPPPALFFDEYVNEQNQCCNWTFPCCHGGTQRLFDMNRRAPPSYSSIFPSYREFDRLPNNYINNYDGHMPLLINNYSSFIAPIPPPNYAQDQGICVAESLEQLISNSANGIIWSPRSTTAICPRCATLVFTVVEMQQTITTHIMAIAFFLMGCWPCCILPYCIDSCKTSHHYCPYCRTYLGTYTP